MSMGMRTGVAGRGGARAAGVGSADRSGTGIRPRYAAVEGAGRTGRWRGQRPRHPGPPRRRSTRTRTRTRTRTGHPRGPGGTPLHHGSTGPWRATTGRRRTSSRVRLRPSRRWTTDTGNGPADRPTRNRPTHNGTRATRRPRHTGRRRPRCLGPLRQRPATSRSRPGKRGTLYSGSCPGCQGTLHGGSYGGRSVPLRSRRRGPGRSGAVCRRAALGAALGGGSGAGSALTTAGGRGAPQRYGRGCGPALDGRGRGCGGQCGGQRTRGGERAHRWTRRRGGRSGRLPGTVPLGIAGPAPGRTAGDGRGAASVRRTRTRTRTRRDALRGRSGRGTSRDRALYGRAAHRVRTRRGNRRPADGAGSLARPTGTLNRKATGPSSRPGRRRLGGRSADRRTWTRTRTRARTRPRTRRGSRHASYRRRLRGTRPACGRVESHGRRRRVRRGSGEGSAQR